MSEIGVDIPNNLRSLVRRVHDGNTFYGLGRNEFKNKFFDFGNDLLNKIDKLSIQARERSREFLSVFLGKESEAKEKINNWSLIRKYSASGTSFQYYRDPISPDSVVVVTQVLKNSKSGSELKGKSDIYWVSTDVDPKNHLPFVYKLFAHEVVRSERGVKRLDIEYRAHLLFDDGKNPNYRIWAENIFSCDSVSSQGKQVVGKLREITVWKKGSILKQKMPSVTRKESQIPVGQLQPEPIPI